MTLHHWLRQGPEAPPGANRPVSVQRFADAQRDAWRSLGGMAWLWLVV